MTLTEQTTDDGTVLIPSEYFIPGTFAWAQRQIRDGKYVKSKTALIELGTIHGWLAIRKRAPDGLCEYLHPHLSLNDINATDWEIVE